MLVQVIKDEIRLGSNGKGMGGIKIWITKNFII